MASVRRTTKKLHPLLHFIFFVPLAILIGERIVWTMSREEFSYRVEAMDPPIIVQSGHMMSGRPPPVEELTGFVRNATTTCPDGLVMISDVHIPTSHIVTSRRIPKIVHQTSKSRCLTKLMADITKHWRFKDWSYCFHDDAAIDRLFQMDFPEFPHLKAVANCLVHGTLKADLWRYLVLWVYGGVYVDLDSMPAKFDANTIQPSGDGFFVVEQYHILSQYFMAVSPRHPLMYYAIQHSLLNVLRSHDTAKVDAAKTTGPHALHKAYMSFRQHAGIEADPLGVGYKPVWKGHFEGTC